MSSDLMGTSSLSENFFAELQMLSIKAGDDVQKYRQMCNEILSIFKSQPDYDELLGWFASIGRNLETQTLRDADGFMVQPDTPATILPEHLRDDGTGFTRGNFLVYDGRFVYPVKDTNGDVMGWCGYDKFEAPKYLDSTTYGYKAKESTLYGMERLRDYYMSDEPVFVTEGIVCTLWLRQSGFQALASLGSHLTPYVIEILKRFGDRLIMIPDSDEAGLKYKKQCKYALPKARVMQSRVAKDIDDSRQKNDELSSELHRCFNRFYASPLFR